MLQFLGRLLISAGARPQHVRYLTKAEAEPVWREGRLLAVDPQGATFETQLVDGLVVECLPWGSVGAVQLRLRDEDCSSRAEGAAPSAHPPTSDPFCGPKLTSLRQSLVAPGGTSPTIAGCSRQDGSEET